MHHIPITSVVGYESEERLFAPFRTLLEAYQNRGRWTLAGRTFDFASAGGRIILDITGHHHAERQTFRNGILHVTEPCDAAYWDEGTGAAPWCAIPPKRAEGTVFEQTFDAVQLDTKRGIVFFTRVGGGEDRAIHVTPAKVKVGERMAFHAPLLKGPVTWGCYDADRIEKTPHRRNKYLSHFKYFNDIATISDDGTLLATKVGESMVMARDANFNKEIWPVTVVERERMSS